MHLIRNKNEFKNKRILEISFLSSLILILFLIQITNISPLLSFNNKAGDHHNLTTYNDKLNVAADDPILFQGTEDPLNITDYGNLYKSDQEVSLTNEEELNLSYYLDDVNNWKISKIENSITNIQDTRNWVNNSDIESITIFKVNEVHESPHPYPENQDKSSFLDTVSETGAIAMRVHFTYIDFQDDVDFIFIEDKNDEIFYLDTGYNSDFFSPWILGDTLQIYYETDNTEISLYDGYVIDYYEFINESSNYDVNLYSWDSYNQTDPNVRTTFGSGFAENISAFYLGLHGEISWSATYQTYRATYWQDDLLKFIKIFQFHEVK